jgi:hypothetical protein
MYLSRPRLTQERTVAAGQPRISAASRTVIREARCVVRIIPNPKVIASSAFGTATYSCIVCRSLLFIYYKDSMVAKATVRLSASLTSRVAVAYDADMWLTIHQVAQMLDMDRANAYRLVMGSGVQTYLVQISPAKFRYEIDESDLELLRHMRQRPAR